MIQRTEFVIDVAGASAAERQFSAVAAAERKMGDAAKDAGASLDKSGGALKALGAGLDTILKPLRMAAYILPGFGIAGIIGGIASVIGDLAGEAAKAFGPNSDAVKGPSLMTDALAGYDAQLDVTIRKVKELAAAQVAVGRNALAGGFGVAAQGVVGGVAAAEFGSQAAQFEARRKALDEQAAQIAADERKLRERAAGYATLKPGAPGLYALEKDVIDAARVIGQRKAAFKVEEEKLRDQVVDFRAAVRKATGDFGASDGRGGGRARPGAGPKDVSEDEIYSMIYGGKSGPAYKQPVAQSDYEALGNLGRASQSVNKPTEEIKQQFDALKNISTGWRETLTGMASDASNAAGLVASAMGQMAQAVGNHLANLIIAGEFGAKSLKKDIGNILAGISAQAFGYAVLLEAMAAASALVPFAGLPAATGLAAAGGIMAGAGVALGVTARLLGADPVGGRGGHASGGGAGSSGGGGAPYNGFRQSGQDTHVTVIIGGEVVTRGVTAETRRLERRGGITEPRLQRAGAGA